MNLGCNFFHAGGREQYVVPFRVFFKHKFGKRAAGNDFAVVGAGKMNGCRYQVISYPLPAQRFIYFRMFDYHLLRRNHGIDQFRYLPVLSVVDKKNALPVYFFLLNEHSYRFNEVNGMVG